jgi:hypothetical protein
MPATWRRPTGAVAHYHPGGPGSCSICGSPATIHDADGDGFCDLCADLVSWMKGRVDPRTGMPILQGA